MALTRARDALIIEWPQFQIEKSPKDEAAERTSGYLLANQCGIIVSPNALVMNGKPFPARVIHCPKEMPAAFDSEPTTPLRQEAAYGRTVVLAASACETARLLLRPRDPVPTPEEAGGIEWDVLADPEGNEFCILRSEDEIAEIEEQHVSHYESILDPTMGWFENLVLHQYHECWMYYSFMQDEIDPRVKQLYELHLNMEIEHLRVACDMLRDIVGREPEELLPKSVENTICFKENKAYVRKVLAEQIDLTAKDSEFVPVGQLPKDDRYFDYQAKVNGDWVPTEAVIEETIAARGREYRLETEGPNPVEGLRPAEDRNGSSTDYARITGKAA